MDSTLLGIPYNDWRFVNTFAPWLSGIASSLVVLLTGYILYREKFVRIKFKTSFATRIYTPIGLSESTTENYVSLKVSNVGFRKMKIDNVAIEYAPKFILGFKPLVMKDNYETELPLSLPEEEDVEISIPLSLLKSCKSYRTFKRFRIILSTTKKDYKIKITKRIIKVI